MTRPSPYGDQTGGITAIVLARDSEKPPADAITFALIVSVPSLPKKDAVDPTMIVP